ncbi:MAG: hypothetical protein ACRDJX_08110, partial [Solirubrobacteraceae bacterium]
GTVALVAEHFASAARLAGEAHLPEAETAQMREGALRHGEAAGDAAAALFSNTEAFAHYEAALVLVDRDTDTSVRIEEKRGDVALRLGQVDAALAAWERCLAFHSERGGTLGVAELERKIGAGLAHKGERKSAIAHLQSGINLIKDDEPTLTLVRLYEEAAWLYMQVGDNMLAIYASEKALHMAQELGEARAASRAHGIFGRVFGRIGDGAKARENLERAVELARESDAGETVLALLALGHNLEHVEGDYSAASECYREALALAERIGDVPGQIELQSALAQLAYYRADWAEMERATDAGAQLAEREGLVGKLCLANALRGRLRWRDGDWEASAGLLAAAAETAEQMGWSEVALSALAGRAQTLRDMGDLGGAELALTAALAVCERAGLAPQSIQIYSSMALLRTLAEEPEGAAEAARCAREIAARVHEPAGRAAALEASAIVGELPGAIDELRAARAGWEELGRPLDAARCELLLGRRLMDGASEQGRATLSRAAELYRQLGVPHLVAKAKELADAGG